MRAMILAVMALGLVSGETNAQTVPERLEKARTEVNTTQNAADRALTAIRKGDVAKATIEVNATKNAASRALYAIDKAIEVVKPPVTPPPPPATQTCPDGKVILATEVCPVPPPPPPPATQTCPDGKVILATEVCPVPPSPPPSAEADELAESLEGYANRIVTDFNYMDALQPAWGTGAIPPEGGTAPDTVGAFRETCDPVQLRYADFILYPGQEGKSHLHDFNGNKGVTASSTFDSLLASGGSGCNWMTGAHANHAVQRSAYWMPALLDGKGNAVRPDYITLYYKRLPKSSPLCGTPTGTGVGPIGICLEIPNGLKIITGYDFVSKTQKPDNINTWSPSNYFACDTDGKKYTTLAAFAAGSPTCKQMTVNNEFPNCWNGKHLWKVDRSHVVYPKNYNSDGKLHCPPSNPYLITSVSLKYTFNVAGLDLTKLELSSDAMRRDLPPGSTLHSDLAIVWDARVKKMMHDNCIDGRKNASGGDLCNGLQLRGGSQPSYGWSNPNRLVPLSSIPMTGMSH